MRPTSTRCPLVLLHGLGTGPSGWRPQVDALAGTRDVAVPRLRPSLRAAAQDVAALVAERAPADVCGLSFGALVALGVALREPESVRRLVLVAGFARLPGHLRALQHALAAVARAVPDERLRRGLAAGVPPPFREDALRELQLSRADVARVMREGARFDVRARLEDVDAPVLVLCGARDRANRPLSAQLAAALPHAHLELVADAGHVANLDAPALFTRLLREFLDEPDYAREM